LVPKLDSGPDDVPPPPSFLPQYDDVLIFGHRVGCLESLNDVARLESLCCSIGRLANRCICTVSTSAVSLLIWPGPWHKKFEIWNESHRLVISWLFHLVCFGIEIDSRDMTPGEPCSIASSKPYWYAGNVDLFKVFFNAEHFCATFFLLGVRFADA
jgi:hypothetical protein